MSSKSFLTREKVKSYEKVSVVGMGFLVCFVYFSIVHVFSVAIF